MNKKIESIGLSLNIISFILTMLAICIPWYSISFKGDFGGNSYDTVADFGLRKYRCEFLNGTKYSVVKEYGVDEGSECYPIVPPTASLFGLGIGLFIAMFFIGISIIPSFAGMVLQVSMLRFPKFKAVWVKIAVFLLSIVTLVFYVIGFLFSSGINTNLQSYNSDDQQSTSSDEFTAKLCDDLWCTSSRGSSNYSPLVQNLDASWGWKSGFYAAIFSCVFSFMSGVFTLLLPVPVIKNQHEYSRIQ